MTRQEILAIAKPILFNSEMVRALQDDRKTVTRRPLKIKYKDDEHGFQIITNTGTGKFVRMEMTDEDECGIFADGTERYVTQPCYIGDYLYVRETWGRAECRNCPTEQCSCYPSLEANFNHGYIFRADSISLKHAVKWHPSIHMPKEAARIFLRVTKVRAERLQEIDVSSCVREGVTWHEYPCAWTVMAKPAFIDSWDSTIKKKDLDRYGWDASPWVWVIEFERVEANA